MPNIILIKGQPNSGKTTLAKQLLSLPKSILIESDWEMIKLIHKGKIKIPGEFSSTKLAQTYHQLSAEDKKLLHNTIAEEINFSLIYFDNVIIEGYLFTLPEYEDLCWKNMCVVNAPSTVEEVKERIRQEAIERIQPIFGRYQRFDFLDYNTDSDSIGKLKALNLPDNMTGIRVLDVGCNNGFFTFECVKRGAECTGIDNADKGIEVAEIVKTSIYFCDAQFKLMDLNDLPGGLGTFDYILCLSTLHYFKNQKEIIEKLIDMLNPEGVLKLEVGITVAKQEFPGKYYFTFDELSWIGDCEINTSVNQAGDSIPRYVITVTK